MEIDATRYSVVAMPVKIQKREHFPPEVQDRMISNDFVWAAKNKDRLVAEWRKRYDGKTEPKKWLALRTRFDLAGDMRFFRRGPRRTRGPLRHRNCRRSAAEAGPCPATG